MLQIAICDDDARSRTLLDGYVRKLLQETDDCAQVCLFDSAEALLAQYPRKLDILLLDIMMEGMSGMDAAKKIRAFDDTVKIIFITNLQQFALEGYKVRAYGYLVKPVSYEDFRMELQTLIANTISAGDREIMIHTRGSSFLLSIQEINYIESQNAKVVIHTESGSVTRNSSLSALEEVLAEYGFIRCHHAFLVNAAKVVGVHGNELELRDKTIVYMSKGRRSACVRMLSRYMRGV